MKRSEALASLSRDHHKALVVAKKLRDATEPAPARETFLEYWQPHGRRHFRIEEEVMLPHWARDAREGGVDREQVARMLDEHLRIRRDALRVADGDITLEELHELGTAMSEHVRFEERELFSAIESSLEEHALSDLAEAVEKAESEGCER